MRACISAGIGFGMRAWIDLSSSDKGTAICPYHENPAEPNMTILTGSCSWQIDICGWDTELVRCGRKLMSFG